MFRNTEIWSFDGPVAPILWLPIRSDWFHGWNTRGNLMDFWWISKGPTEERKLEPEPRYAVFYGAQAAIRAWEMREQFDRNEGFYGGYMVFCTCKIQVKLSFSSPEWVEYRMVYIIITCVHSFSSFFEVILFFRDFSGTGCCTSNIIMYSAWFRVSRSQRFRGPVRHHRLANFAPI